MGGTVSVEPLRLNIELEARKRKTPKLQHINATLH